MRIHILFMAAAAVVVVAAHRPSQAATVLDAYNVVWNSPSVNSQGSMPLGNGDVGVNVWTENGRALVFYLSKTDAWDENGSLLKLGKVRVSLPEGTFAAAGPFKQELRLQDGTIQIDVGTGDAATTVKLWIDPNNPVVQIDVRRAVAFNADVTFEPWRTGRRQLVGQELEMAYGEVGSPTPVYIEPDTVITDQTDRILWYHRNERSVWAKNLEVQGLDPNNTVGVDPLIRNTFGAAVTGDNLQSVAPAALRTAVATTRQVISVHALTARTDTAGQWIDQLDARIAKTESTPYDQRKAANDRWWSNFTNHSYIRVTAGPNADAVSRGYAVQRTMNAFAGRGAAPIKFNGSIFTVDTYGRTDLGAENNMGPDYRRWGGPYWLQNTRLIYWSMLESGDFQQLQPFFDLYLNNLALAKQRVKTYYGAEARGAYFPETMTPWGTWTGNNYGWNNPNPKSGVAENKYIRYEWQGGIEVTAMMLQYYEFTGDRRFVREKLLPLATEIVTFYDTHFGRDAAGKILFQPAQSLETWRTAVNPLPEVAGLHYVLDKLLALPETETTAEQREQWSRLKSELPAIPTQRVKGKTIFTPGQSFADKQNIENPELYGVFPYLISGVGKENLQIGIDTYNNRLNKLGAKGWSQDPIDAAMLGLADAAQALVVQGFSSKDSGSRFAGFYGPNYDWISDNDQPSAASIALQRMLVQVDGQHVELFPAWPADWDVEFKLFGPSGLIIMGDFEKGAVKWLDPVPDGTLTRADYRLVLGNLGYDNQSGKGDFESLTHGDVNFDGRVTNADRIVLISAAAELGIDTSGWTVPEPCTAIMLALASVFVSLQARRDGRGHARQRRTATEVPGRGA